MRCSESELEKKVNSILDYLDSLELEKEPLSKCSEHFFEYIKQKIESAEGGVIRENPFNPICEYGGFIDQYDTGVNERIQEWRKVSSEKLSELLKEEIGMNNEDIEVLKKPFRSLMVGTGFLNYISKIFDIFDIDFSVSHRNRKMSIYNFFNRLNYNKCMELSMLYNFSLQALVDIEDMRVEFSGKEIIGNKFLEMMHIPMLRKENGYVDEEAERKEFREFLKLEEMQCNSEIGKCKTVLLKNLKDIDGEYFIIRKENKSLKEYLGRELWA